MYISQVVALAVVSIGVAVATVTDLQFSFFGASVAFSWIIPSAISKILWSSLQQRENWTALAYAKFFTHQQNKLILLCINTITLHKWILNAFFFFNKL